LASQAAKPITLTQGEGLVVCNKEVLYDISYFSVLLLYQNKKLNHKRTQKSTKERIFNMENSFFCVVLNCFFLLLCSFVVEYFIIYFSVHTVSKSRNFNTGFAGVSIDLMHKYNLTFFYPCKWWQYPRLGNTQRAGRSVTFIK